MANKEESHSLDRLEEGHLHTASRHNAASTPQQQDQQDASDIFKSLQIDYSYRLRRDVDNNIILIRSGERLPPTTQASIPDDGAVRHEQNRAKQREKDLTEKKEADAFFDRFFQNMGAVGTLGSSITFALIVSQLQDPLDGVSAKHVFDLSTVRILIAVSWLLFTVTLALSFFMAGFDRYDKLKSTTRNDSRAFMIGILYMLVISAFLCLALVVAAYVEVVGFLAVGLVSYLALVVGSIIVGRMRVSDPISLAFTKRAMSRRV